jgi:hypothetical protein
LVAQKFLDKPFYRAQSQNHEKRQAAIFAANRKLGHIHAPMNEAGIIQPIDQEQVTRKRRCLLYVRVVRLLCFAAAVWIGFEKHWSGLAWIPIGALFVVAVSGFVAARICRSVIHLLVICNIYRLAREFSHLSATDRERLLARMDPEFREHFLHWIKSHVA